MTPKGFNDPSIFFDILQQTGFWKSPKAQLFLQF